MFEQSTILVLGVFYWLNNFIFLSTANPTRAQGLSMCDTYNSIPGTNMIQCNLSKDQFLDYNEVRLWTNKENDTYSVKLSCTGGGTVLLPWPFSAKNVISLEVYGCRLQGFLSEMTTMPAHPHELKTLILSSVSIDLPINSMVSLQNNLDKVPMQTNCGPTTLETLVLRDIHYDLKITPEARDKMNAIKLGRNAGTNHVAVKRCIYPHLKYIDESGSREHGKYHLKLVPEYSEFPMLEVYNMSNNNLNHVPDGFQHLHSKKFPVLKYVDFSNNALKTFEFAFPKDLTSCNLQMLDLRRNQISSMSRSSVHQLQRLGTVLIDLRHNPLRCDCSNVSFIQLLRLQFQNSTDIRRRRLASDVTCTQLDFKTGQTKDVNLMNLTLKNDCKHIKL